jgi:hypothetical protein
MNMIFSQNRNVDDFARQVQPRRSGKQKILRGLQLITGICLVVMIANGWNIPWLFIIVVLLYFHVFSFKKKKQENHVQILRFNDWTADLARVCLRYSAPYFFVAERIPEKKLKKARQVYPPPGGGRIIALLDTMSVYGANGNGMLIGEHGISWHNGRFSAKSKVSSLRWDEFSKAYISRDGSEFFIGSEGVFDVGEICIFGRGNIFDLLRDIQGLCNEFQTQKLAENKIVNDEKLVKM